MIRVEHVKRGMVLARPAHAVLHGHDVVVPAMHDDGRAGDVLRRVGFESGHVEGRRQQEQAARPHARGGRSGDVAPEARSDEHHGAMQAGGGGHELLDPGRRVVQPAIVHRLDRRLELAHQRRHGGDLAPPGTAFLAVGKYHRR